MLPVRRYCVSGEAAGSRKITLMGHVRATDTLQRHRSTRLGASERPAAIGTVSDGFVRARATYSLLFSHVPTQPIVNARI